MHGGDAGPVRDLPAAGLAVTGGEIRAGLAHVAKSRSPTAMAISYFSSFSP